MSKGDKYRPVDKKKFDKNYDRIFKNNKHRRNHENTETNKK